MDDCRFSANPKKYKIAISCVGSGVGQAIINSLRLCTLPIYTVGLGTNPMAYGAYDCDEFDYTPRIYSESYMEHLIRACLKHEINLIFPGNDDEVLLFAQHKLKFEQHGIKAIHAEAPLVALCRDKEKMGAILGQTVDAFLKCYQKHEVEAAHLSSLSIFPLIAKPRGGFGSKGIRIIRNIDDLREIGTNHIIQELAIPRENDPNYNLFMKQLGKGINPQLAEISVQLVYDNAGKQIGRMSTYNKLNNGIPIEIIPFDNPEVWDTVDALTPALLDLGLKGPLNIQGRLTASGFKIFEMNPRFTGITGLRALMGFNEVVACAKEWLGIDKGANTLALNHNRFGIRQTADKSIALECNHEVAQLSSKINKRSLKSKRTILLTGATGYLGRQLTKSILEANDQFELITLGRDKEKSKVILGNSNIQHFNYDDLRSGNFFIGNADILLHAGFARPHCTHQEIAQSLAFTTELFTTAAMSQVPVIINISSQSVYGLKQPPPWLETTSAAPETAYAQAKYASEQLLISLNQIYPHINATSIRLGALAGGYPGLVEADFMTKMVKQALNQDDIRLILGKQQIERLDVKDATEGILQLLNYLPPKLKSVYNLGYGTCYSLKHIAELIAETVAQMSGTKKVDIIVEPISEELPSFGMTSDLFFSEFNWKPKCSMGSTIISIIKYVKSKK
jgi:nucleoside-diphosphate-sugar epimerase